MSWRTGQTLFIWFKVHMANTFLVEWKSAGFRDKWNDPPFSPWSAGLNGGVCGLSGVPECCVQRGVETGGNSLRVTLLWMGGKCRQESRRPTGKYNPSGGVPFYQHSFRQESDRQTQTDTQGRREGERCYYSVRFPLLNGVWKPGHTFSMKHNLSGFGNLNSLKLSGCPFSIS